MTLDMSGLALECVVVSRARALTEWVGAGRPVTAKGVLRRADVADAARAVGVEAPPRVRTAADIPEMHHPWLVAQAAGWLRVHAHVAIASSPAGGEPLGVWSAGLDAVLREESQDLGQRGARLTCRAVLTALATNPPTPRDQLEETVHALLDHSQLGDVTAVYQAFRRGIMPVDAALEVLADFGALDDAKQPTLTPLGRWAWQQLRPAAAVGMSAAEHLSAAELLTALASLDECEASALAKRWFVARHLADAGHQLLKVAATTTPAERIAVVDLIASLGEATTSVWRAAPNCPCCARRSTSSPHRACGRGCSNSRSHSTACGRRYGGGCWSPPAQPSATCTASSRSCSTGTTTTCTCSPPNPASTPTRTTDSMIATTRSGPPVERAA